MAQGDYNRKSLEECNNYASKFGGVCLSDTYTNVKTKLNWKCKEGHIFSRVFSNMITRNNFCLICDKKREEYSIEYCNKLAEEHNGKCLSKIYINFDTKLKWQCKNNHIFFMNMSYMRSNKNFCSICADKERRYTIEDCQVYALNFNGECLSKKYISVKKKMKWKCQKGHIFEDSFSAVMKHKDFCPVCGKASKRLTIKECREYAKNYEGECLSAEYKDLKTGLNWKCKENHVFKRQFSYMKYHDSFCPICEENNPVLVLKDCHEHAKRHEGSCLSKKYITVSTKMKWQCNNGHVFNRTFAEMRNNDSFCTICSANEKSEKLHKLKLIECHEYAKKMEGKCLSSVYVNSETAVEWQCKHGHVFNNRFNNIKNSHQWCPCCNTKSRGEKIVRAYFEQLFNVKFISIRPDWLRNPKTNFPLELDGYNENLLLSFEYNGSQHYNTTTHMIKNKTELDNIQYRDEIKRTICKKRKIVLIEIPEIDVFIKRENLKEYIKQELIKNNYPLPENFDLINPNIADVLKESDSDNRLEELKNIIESKGGELLSNCYTGWYGKLKVDCGKGHIVDMLPSSLYKGCWCAKCSGGGIFGGKHGIDGVIPFYEKKYNLKCLSEKWTGSKDYYIWECDNNHTFKMSLGGMEHRLKKFKCGCLECVKEEKKNEYR